MVIIYKQYIVLPSVYFVDNLATNYLLHYLLLLTSSSYYRKNSTKKVVKGDVIDIISKRGFPDKT